MDKKLYDEYISYWNDQYFTDKVDEFHYKKKIRDIEIAYLKSQYSNKEIDKDSFISKKIEIELELIKYRYLNREINSQEYQDLKSTLYQKYSEYSEDNGFKPGEIVSGRYKILRKIGEGGMATVYLALDNLDRDVVIKKIKPHLLSDDSLIERFIREAHAQAKLKHPNIALVLDFDKSSLSLIQDYIEGEDLESLLQRKQLSETEALNIFKEILKGLCYAHDNNIIHRDIKPSNILMDNFYSPKITDFGIAKIIGEDSQTQTGVSMGTPAYMSPEQIQGDKQIDIRTDIYSCGIMLYEMLTGILPFSGTDHTLKSMHINKIPEKPSNINNDLSESLSAIVMKAISKEPSDRYADCNEFLNAIEQYEEYFIKPDPFMEPEEHYAESRKTSRRNPLILPVIIIIILLSSFLIYRTWYPDQNIEKRAWNKLMDFISPEISREEMEALPDGGLTDITESILEDRKRHDREAWQSARQEDTVTAFENYINSYPEGIYVNAAKIRIAEITDEKEAKAIEMEDKLWEQVRDANTIESFNKYIKAYPDGRYKYIADRRIEYLLKQEKEDSAYFLAKSQNTISSYKEYLYSYPDGRYSREAISMMEELRKPPDLMSENPPSTYTNSIDIEFILVEPGFFLRGSPDSDESACESEKPQHRVTISRPYYIGRYPVTQKQWKKIMSSNPSKFEGDNRPVETVSWLDVQKFISKLNEMEGHNRYRLPTEAEWEFAARGGKKSENFIYSGSNNIEKVAWYGRNSGDRYIADDEYILHILTNKTNEVGQKYPNELGIYDMSGNVYEWCSDWYGDYDAWRKTDPPGPSVGLYRVIRGGSIFSLESDCRIAHRASSCPSISVSAIGFRLVMGD